MNQKPSAHPTGVRPVKSREAHHKGAETRTELSSLITRNAQTETDEFLEPFPEPILFEENLSPMPDSTWRTGVDCSLLSIEVAFHEAGLSVAYF